ASTLGLVDKAGAAGATLDELVSSTGSSTSALAQLLAHLVTIGVFELDPDTRRYRPTDLSQQLTDNALLLDMKNAGGRAELAFVDLLDTIATGKPSYPKRYGRTFWEDLDSDPRLRSSFDAQMNWRFRTQATQIAERFDWSRYPNIFDVGGGDGTLLTAILQRHSTVRGTVLDLPPTSEAAGDRFAEAGLTDRASALGGSFFDPIPAGADVYILSDILHDWDDDHAAVILAETARAAGGNTVVIIESIRGISASTGVDLFMLMCFGSRERSMDELTDMAGQVGLGLHTSTTVADGRTALEFRRTR
uniref:methyltransferase n=1 Tax=Rhodococcoides yunnanense TaxID=278209 RepID=UPI001C3F82B5